MSALGSSSAAAETVFELQWRPWKHPDVLSAGLGVTQIMGPAVPLLGSPARPHMCQLNGVERGQGLGVILEVQRDLQEDFLYFQVRRSWATTSTHPYKNNSQHANSNSFRPVCVVLSRKDFFFRKPLLIFGQTCSAFLSCIPCKPSCRRSEPGSAAEVSHRALASC